MTKAVATPIAVFLCSVAIYLALWNYIADGRLHGADAINVVVSRASQSYSLKQQDIGNQAKFFARLADAHDPAGRFVSGLLSEQGRNALLRLAQGGDADADRQLVLFELNSRIIDAQIAWPVNLLPAEWPTAGNDLSGRQQYNRQVMSSLFNNNIIYNKRMSFRELIAGKINFKSFFVLNSPTRYAPLTAIYTTMMTLFILDDPGNLPWAALLVACLYGLQMLFFYLLAFEALKSIRWAMVSTFLFMTSFPALLTTYSLFSLPYFFIPLTICAAAFFYLRYRSMEQGGHIYLVLYCLAAFVGPWFREAALVMPSIVFAVELVTYRGRRSLAVMLPCLALMVHGIYPSLFTWLIGVNTGSYYSILQGAAMKSQMGSGLNLAAPGTVFVQIPPVLWLGAVLAMVAATRRFPFGLEKDVTGVHARLFSVLAAMRSASRLEGAFRCILPLALAVVCVAVVVNFFGDYSNPGAPSKWGGLALFALFLLFALYSLKHSVFFPVFFMAMLLPFMRISGNTEIHTSFILPPLIIMIVFWLRELYRMRATMKRPTAIFVAALLMLGIADQGMNLYACASSQRAAITTNREMGAWLAGNTPRHSILVSNFFNIADVFYYSGYHFDPFESVENCPLGPAKVVHKNEDMKKLLEGNMNIRPFYLAAADLDYYEYQKNYHSHKYVKSPPGKLKEMARFKTLNRYWYLDPFKYFIPRWFVSIPVYMDWSIDFYYNNEKMPFQRVLKADYTIYRLEDISLDSLKEKPEAPVVVAAPATAAKQEPVVPPPVVTASSVMDKNNPGMSPSGILNGDGIWHAQSPPKYPEWIDISYPAPFVAISFSLLPQQNSPGGNEHVRAPKDFRLLASKNRKKWIELLSVKDNIHKNGEEWRHWKLKNKTPWRYYRLRVTASGEPTLLTIKQIRIEGM